MGFTANNIVNLLQVKGIGRGKIFKLESLLKYTPTDDYEWVDALLENKINLSIATLNKEDILQSFKKGQEISEKSQVNNIKIIGFWDAQFPKKLREIAIPPVLLNVRGNLENLNIMSAAAVIGTREPSDYGRLIGERIGFRFGENKINVISGLAKGCDTAAHVGCLKANGVTTAILAHGLDYIYPKENSSLAQQILEKEGCLVSEYVINTRAQPSFFVERDRLQSGLASATVVIETAIKGGTMHAVKATIDSRKILAAFNHPPNKSNEKSKGNEMLLTEGKAIGLQSKKDIDDLILRINPDILKIKDDLAEQIVIKSTIPEQFEHQKLQVELEQNSKILNDKKGLVEPVSLEIEKIAKAKYDAAVADEKSLKEILLLAKKNHQNALLNKKNCKAELDKIKNEKKTSNQIKLL